MRDEILKWLLEHYPVIFLITVLIVIAVILTWKTAHWVNRVKKVETECGKIDGHIAPQLGILTTSINNLVVYLKSKDGGMDASLFKTQSPVMLTDIGNRILSDFGGKYFIDNNLGLLINALELQSTKSALDIQNNAPIILGGFMNADDFTPIKNKLFSDPVYKTNNIQGQQINIALDLTTYLNIMGIYLRDKYLERRSVAAA